MLNGPIQFQILICGFSLLFSLPHTQNMSSVNRVLEKRRKAHTGSSHPVENTASSQTDSISHVSTGPSQPQERVTFDPDREKLYQQYAEYSQYNASSIEFSNTYAPNSLSLYNRYRAPMSCFITPIYEELEYTERSGAAIPRCGSCRAYMNYYNQVNKKGFKCFLCGRENPFDCDYDPTGDYIQRSNPNILVDGPSGIYNDIPPEKVFIFLVDVSREAWQCKMISYMVTVLKEVFSREEMNETQIYFYTYDEAIHQYDFSGEEVERTILDPTIKQYTRSNDNFLVDIRDKLLALLDSLEDVAEKNSRNGSNFYPVFEYVYESIRHTGGKIFIFQANEAIIGESFTNQNVKPVAGAAQNAQPKSFLQTKNKVFFNRFVQPMLGDNISMSLFIFGRAYKNIRVFSDCCKLTNSELLYYSKDCLEDLNKFYYELYDLVGANYYQDVRVEFMISAGWYYTAVYGNLYRLKEFITFKFCHLERSKRICAVFLPQEGFNPVPYFSIQIVTNYLSNRKHYLQVTTAVLPFTTSIDTLFENINYQISAVTIFRTFLSSLRLEDIASCKNKYTKQVALIWKAAHDHYKGDLPPEFRNMVLGFMAFLKHYHSQIDLINDTIILDRMIAQRNLLQACNYQDPSALFSPYLFDLTTIGNDRCLQDNFIYPDVCDLRFQSVKQGLFLLDAGVALYLYISRSYHPDYLRALFGKDKLVKGDVLTEDLITAQEGSYSQQVQNLVRVLRESKTYGWVPLYVVRCGEGSLNEKNFYLNFFEEKYEEFRSSRLSYEEFINMLSKQY